MIIFVCFWWFGGCKNAVYCCRKRDTCIPARRRSPLQGVLLCVCIFFVVVRLHTNRSHPSRLARGLFRFAVGCCCCRCYSRKDFHATFKKRNKPKTALLQNECHTKVSRTKFSLLFVFRLFEFGCAAVFFFFFVGFTVDSPLTNTLAMMTMMTVHRMQFRENETKTPGRKKNTNTQNTDY